VHFTREPIIETIITPREGHKLILRSARHQESSEEFCVDMVEVIALGHQAFYRYLDKPKSFILPASDYELVEVRETRVMLKAPAIEQDIKIAGGKEAKKEKEVAATPETKQERRRKKTRKAASTTEAGSKPVIEEEVPLPRPPVSVEKPILIPPPSTLISDTIARYKEMSAIEELALEEQSHEEDNFESSADETPESNDVPTSN